MDREISISVIIPIYNVSEFLVECLDSVEAAIGELSMEILLIDDGSTDDSGEIAKQYADEHPAFKYFHKENGGLGSARNYGVKQAQGKYISFIDSDDVIVSDMYSNMFRKAEASGSEVTFCNVARFTSDRKWESNLHLSLYNGMTEDFTTHITKNYNLFYDTIACNKLILKSFWDKHNFKFPENHMLFEDIPVILPMHFLANKVSVIRKVEYLWRVREGESKSITQSNTRLKNLTDRLTVIKRVLIFYREHSEDKELLNHLQLKLYKLDLTLFVQLLGSMPKKNAMKFISLIKDFINEYMDTSLITLLPSLKRQKFIYLLKNDLEGIKSVEEFQKKEYKYAPVIFENGEYLFDLPSNIFSEKKYPATNDFSEYGPSLSVNSIYNVENKIIIESFLYNSKINTSKPEDLFVTVNLVGNTTDNIIPLQISKYKSNKTTSQYGDVPNPITNKIDQYDYSYSDFDIILDFDELSKKSIAEDDYFIDCNYILPTNSGNKMLRKAFKRFIGKCKNHSYIVNNKIFTICFDSIQLIYLHVEDIKNTTKLYLSDDGIITTNKNVFIRTIDDLYSAEEDADYSGIPSLNSIDSKELDYNSYVVCDFEDNTFIPIIDHLDFLYKKINDYYVAIYNDIRCRMMIEKAYSIACIEKISVNDSSLGFSFNLYTFEENINSAEIFYNDNVVGIDRILTRFELQHTEYGYKGSCNIDFDDKKRNILYSGRKQLLLRINNQDLHLLCQRPIDYTIKFENMSILVNNDSNNSLLINVFHDWSNKEFSKEKRTYIKNYEYELFRQEPIQENIIIFESKWGAKYADNPRALYEYIDKNHPEYLCVWSLNDPGTPINGNGIKIRRKSREYYHYLAVAKYFVNDVNFEDAYIKRTGQIEIQTMHGTPYKLFGLEIKDEFETKNSVWKYVRKNMRWDYLISQGKFTNSKAYQWFKYYKTILNTGYPRTDAIMNKDNDFCSQLKKQLNIPLDKKIVLYAPTWRELNNFDLKINLDSFMNTLGDDYILVIRIHYLSASGYIIPEKFKNVIDLTSYSNIEDLYQISDILVTDYSSVMFDYALTGKPIIFYTYDLNEYEENLRGVYFDLKTEAPGPIVYTDEELANAIINIDSEVIKYKERINSFKNKYLTFENPHSCEKIFKLVFEDHYQTNKAKRIESTEDKIFNHSPKQISSLYEKVKIHSISLDATNKKPVIK